LLTTILFGCMQEKVKENRELDNAFLDVQRMSLWHREYSFLVIKFRGKDQDSVTYYEHKMDSALSEYQYYLRRYNDMVLEHQMKK
jgi:hypothetical protein